MLGIVYIDPQFYKNFLVQGLKKLMIYQQPNDKEIYIHHCASRLKEVLFSMMESPFLDLLSLGERKHIFQFRCLNQTQWNIFSLLQRRVPQNYKKFQMEFQEEKHGIDELIKYKLVDVIQKNKRCLNLLSKAELQHFCAEKNISNKGTRKELQSRLHEFIQDLAIPKLICVKNPKLLERCIAWMNNSHQGTWDKDIHLFLSQSSNFPIYNTTSIPAMYTRRFDYWSYYYGRHLFENEMTIQRIYSTRPPTKIQFRFSLYRQFFLNKEWIQSKDAPSIIQVLKQKLPYLRKEICIIQLDFWLFQHQKITDTKYIQKQIQFYEQEDFEIFELDLRQKIKLIAAQHNLFFFPRYKLHQPKKRYLYLQNMKKHRQRITFELEGENKNVEQSVIFILQKYNKIAFHTENHAWQALIEWLFIDLFYEPISHMLPYPNMRYPLDFHWGTLFYQNRKHQIEQRLEWLTKNATYTSQFTEKIQMFFDEIEQKYPNRLMHRHQVEFLMQSFSIVELIPLIRYLLQNPHSFKGLPDLVVQSYSIPKPEILQSKHSKMFQLVPDKIIPSKSFFIEVKCKDPVSNAQKFWHHKLIEMGFQVEIWNLREMN